MVQVGSVSKCKVVARLNEVPRLKDMQGGRRIRPPLLTSTLGGVRTASRPCRFTLRENNPRYPLYRRLGRPQNRSGRYGDVFLPPGI
jgi:hypothetical protein